MKARITTTQQEGLSSKFNNLEVNQVWFEIPSDSPSTPSTKKSMPISGVEVLLHGRWIPLQEAIRTKKVLINGTETHFYPYDPSAVEDKNESKFVIPNWRK
jgi:hypothetical protein